jgi:hypothetical protein
LVIQPDGEVVQGHPCRQASPQPTPLVGRLLPEAEGVEELVVVALRDLVDGCHPTPQALGPGLATIAFERVDDPRGVALLPRPVVLGALKTLAGHVRARGHRAHADEPRVRSGFYGEGGFGDLLVGG